MNIIRSSKLVQHNIFIQDNTYIHQPNTIMHAIIEKL